MFRGDSLRLARFAAATAIGAAALVLSNACRPPQVMANQPSYKPYASSALFTNGSSARELLAGTVARGHVDPPDFYRTGKVNGVFGDGFPMQVTRETLARGHERFDIYCSPCHGRVGNGDGMIPRRGYRRPPSFHTDDLRSRPSGHYFDVMTNGFGAMPQYGTMIPVRDRWTIVAYIRALQLSEHATIADVPPPQRAALDGGGAPR
jgi:Cytochrome C oxidase, cbb3-type, subunit III